MFYNFPPIDLHHIFHAIWIEYLRLRVFPTHGKLQIFSYNFLFVNNCFTVVTGVCCYEFSASSHKQCTTTHLIQASVCSSLPKDKKYNVPSAVNLILSWAKLDLFYMHTVDYAQGN